MLGLCLSRRQVFASRKTTQRNSNILTSAFRSQSRRPRKELQLRGVQSTTNMFQQRSGCRKCKNITYFVNITLPTSCTDGRRATGLPRREIQGPAQAQVFVKTVLALPNATNTWQHYNREAEDAPDGKEKATKDQLSDEGRIKPERR